MNSEKLDDGNLNYAKDVYSNVRRKYLKLARHEKGNVYIKVEELYQDILIEEIKKDLEDFSGRKSESASRKSDILSRVEKKINLLPKKKKDEVLSLFEKIKGEVDTSR